MIVLRRLYSKRAPAANFLHKSKKDPGIFQQKKILQDLPHEEIESADLDELESDFMSVHKSHREHSEQLEAMKEKEKYLIVKQKYFKEKYPNFLTWQDKELMRHLYHTNPEEWNIEKLSEGFPAFPEVIEKIVKGKWVKKNQTKILNHDNMVLQNWKDFKQGKMNNLPQQLKEHLQKFSNRTVNLEEFHSLDENRVVVQGQNKNSAVATGEFSEIINSYQRLRQQNTQNLNTEDIKYLKPFVHSSNSHKKSNTLLTFKELQNTVERKIARGKDITVEEKLLKAATFPKKEENSEVIELRKEDISNIIEHKHETKVGFIKKTTRDMSHLIYPEKIFIPKNIYRKKYTYKLNDCYYDSDGEFLYRVPGMG